MKRTVKAYRVDVKVNLLVRSNWWEPECLKVCAVACPGAELSHRAFSIPRNVKQFTTFDLFSPPPLRLPRCEALALFLLSALLRMCRGMLSLRHDS